MHSVNLTRFPSEKLTQVFDALPFFHQLKTEFPQDYQTLFNHSKIVIAETHEAIIRTGEFDSWFYFVLSGSMCVYLDESSSIPLGHIYPAEVVGALAIMHDTERSATVRVSGNKRCVLLAVDYTPFGELDDVSQISVGGKVALLRFVSERTEARLRAYDQQMPGTDLMVRLQTQPSLATDASVEEALHYWYYRIDALANLLKEWNLTLENLDDYHPPLIAPSAELIHDIEQLYFG